MLNYLTNSNTHCLGWIMKSSSLTQDCTPGRADSMPSRKQKTAQMTYIFPSPLANPPSQLVTHHHANTASGTQELEQYQMIIYAYFHTNSHTHILSLSHVHPQTGRLSHWIWRSIIINMQYSWGRDVSIIWVYHKWIPCCAHNSLTCWPCFMHTASCYRLHLVCQKRSRKKIHPA